MTPGWEIDADGAQRPRAVDPTRHRSFATRSAWGHLRTHLHLRRRVEVCLLHPATLGIGFAHIAGFRAPLIGDPSPAQADSDSACAHVIAAEAHVLLRALREVPELGLHVRAALRCPRELSATRRARKVDDTLRLGDPLLRHATRRPRRTATTSPRNDAPQAALRQFQQVALSHIVRTDLSHAPNRGLRPPRRACAQRRTRTQSGIAGADGEASSRARQQTHSRRRSTPLFATPVRESGEVRSTAPLSVRRTQDVASMHCQDRGTRYQV